MNLEKIRTVIPDFEMENFQIFDTITSLSFETEKDELTGKDYKNVSLVLENKENQVELKCLHTRLLRFQETKSIKNFYVSQLEHQGYELGEQGNEELKLYCDDIVIQRCEKL